MVTLTAGGNIAAGRDITITEAGGNATVSKEDRVEQIKETVAEIKQRLEQMGEQEIGQMIDAASRKALTELDRDNNPYLVGLKGVIEMAKAAKEDLAPLLTKLMGLFS